MPPTDNPTTITMDQRLNGAEELHPLTIEEFQEVERKLREYVASKRTSERRTVAHDEQRSGEVYSGRDDEVIKSCGPKDGS